ncbi:MAG: YeeE/YedE family protein [Bacteroidetes bacterium]|nr:YeeE/YedE family protein [Bacteroidota bacterium]
MASDHSPNELYGASAALIRPDTAGAAPYWNPYVSGVLLGLVLLAAYVLMGRGLGASGAFSSVTALAVEKAAPAHAAGNEFYQGYLQNGIGGNPLKSWLVFEVIGVFLGGFLSAALAGRLTGNVAKGPRISVRTRLLFALAGGTMMGIGAKFARGCTSGQGLSGGAVLNVGSWAFMLMVFALAYALAYSFRRLWT